MKKIESFVVASYALVDVIHALHCNGITEITITKQDNNLVVAYDHEQVYRNQKDYYEVKCNVAKE